MNKGNKNYIKGSQLEYRLLNHLKESDKYCFVARTAGSHGMADVIAITYDYEPNIILFQCKKTSKNTIDIGNLTRDNSIIALTMLPNNIHKVLCIKQGLSRDMIFLEWDTFINQWIPASY